MQALQLASMPRITITMRKNYGQAFLNMGGGRNSDISAAWPTADFGFMDPATAVTVLHGDKVKEEPERFQALVSENSEASAPCPSPASTRAIPSSTRGRHGSSSRMRCAFAAMAHATASACIA